MGTLTAATLQKGDAVRSDAADHSADRANRVLQGQYQSGHFGSTIVFTGRSAGRTTHVVCAASRRLTWCGTTAGPQTIVFTNTGDPGTSYHIMSVAFAGTEYTATIGGAPINNNVVQAGTAGVTISIASAAIPGTWSFT